MKKLYATLVCLMAAILPTLADLPFRNHRYDAFNVLPVTSENIVFIGNSITNMHEWWEAFGSQHNIVNRGVSGATSDETLANIEAIASGRPKKVFIMIGTNDLGTAGMNTPEHVMKHVTLMVERFKKTSPNTKIYIQSILPSKLRDEVLQKATNVQLQALCEKELLTYIDLWDDLISLQSSSTHTLDYLHLKASAYKIWCDKIAPYVGDEGKPATCIYPDNTVTAQNQAGLSGSNGMRATIFSMLPVQKGDILIIGDEMISGGEWHELLRSDKVKNRGCGWGYPGLDLNGIANMISAVLDTTSGSCEPAHVVLYAGAGDINGSTDINSLKTKYEEIVTQIKKRAPKAQVDLLGLLPTATAATNTGRVVPFNTFLAQLAAAQENVNFIATYDALRNGDVANTAYFNGNYLYGKGYVKVAQLIAQAIGGDLNAISDAEANALYTSNQDRKTLGTSIVKFSTLPQGDKVGQYTTENLGGISEKLQNAYNLLAQASPSVTDMTNAVTEMNEELERILPLLNMPASSTDSQEFWYQLYTPNRGSRYLTSNGAGAGVVGNDANRFANSIWKFVKRDDNTWDILNRKDKSYLSPVANYNTQITTTETRPENGWTLSYSNSPGLFIISSGTVQLNQTQANLSYKVYNWSAEGNGTDRGDTGCQYMIAEFEGEPDEVSNQILSAAEIVNGWYQVALTTGNNSDAQRLVTNGTNYILTVNEEFEQNVNNFYPLKYAALPTDRPALAFVYITKSGNNFYLTALNGHHLNEIATASRSVPGSLTAISGTGGSLSLGHWGPYNSGGPEQPYVGKYSNSGHKYAYYSMGEEISAKYDVYKVAITGAENATKIKDDVRVTLNHAENKGLNSVYNNGYFFLTKGATLTPQNFSAGSVTGKSAVITIANGIINVTYSSGYYSELGLVIDEALALLESTHAGTSPGCFAPADREILQAAVYEAQVINTTANKSEAEVAEAISTLKKAVSTYTKAEQGIKFSSATKKVWYYITSASTKTYCANKAIIRKEGAPLSYAPKRVDPNMMWCFMKKLNGTIAIMNYSGEYMSKNQEKGHANAGVTTTADYNYSITKWSGVSANGRAFTIKSDASGQPLHAQDANTVIVTWAAEDNGASLWDLTEVSEEELNSELSIVSSQVDLGVKNTGIGNADVALLRTSFTVTGLNGSLELQGIKGTISHNNDIKALRVYHVADGYEYRKGKEDATLLGTGTVAADGTYDIRFTTPHAMGRDIELNYWLVADISADAQEGDIIDAAITGYIVNGKEVEEKSGNPEFDAVVFLTASTVEYLNTYNSRYYRIPGITTAKNGWLVAVTDKRYGSETDLPNNIDVVARVSKDNGLTWTEPVVIAGTPELGGDYGHGDPAIVTDNVTGDIIVLVTSKVGFFSGTPTNPPLIKVIISHDNGLTWDAPIDITSSIYGATCSDPVRSQYNSLFVSSGSFMQTRDGVLMAVAPVRTTSSTTHSTFEAHIISSADHGKTWTMSDVCVLTDADESKIVELDNGDLLVASRHGGYRYYSVSSDGGKTWSARSTWTDLYEPNCNGDMIRYTAVGDGALKNRLLHSIPNAGSRKNVTVFLSTDEGKTWPVKKVICPTGSAYSSLTILHDGTIGCYYEENALEGGFQMRYVRFSLEWLTDGTDCITPEETVGIEMVEKAETVKNGYIYNLSGQRVLSPIKGRIYIQDGKTFIAQ